MAEAHIAEDKDHPADWRVEEIDDDGGVAVAIFHGSSAESRARSYANGLAEVPSAETPA